MNCYGSPFHARHSGDPTSRVSGGMTSMTGSRQGLACWLAVLLVSSAATSIDASDWPRFRGPNGSGVSLDRGVPTELGENKNLLWKVAIPGSGNSSPIASGGKVFLQTATPDGTRRLLLCLDLLDG